MKRNMRSWADSLMRASRRQAIPVLTYPAADKAGLTIREIVCKAGAHAACVGAVAGAYPTAAAMTCMDLSVEAEAFGCKVAFAENEVPTVVAGVIDALDNVDGLRVPDISQGRTPEYIKAAGLAANAVHDRPTLAGMIGPVSLAGRLYDMTEMMVALMLDAKKMHSLLDKAANYLESYALAFKDAGSNGIFIAEPAAGLLSPQQCDEFSSRYVKRIVEAVQDENFMVILHNCGETARLVGSMVSTGCMGYHFGNSVDMAGIMPQIPAECLAMGNIDPVAVMKNGSSAGVMETTQALLRKTGGYHNFVLSTGCDVPPGTPPENIDALFSALESFNAAG